MEDIELTSGITAGVMIQSLRDKDVELFEAMFSRLARLDMAAMLVTIYDPGSESFATGRTRFRCCRGQYHGVL